MIPKIIHYCWFGGKPLPDDVKMCISSWKKYCPGYEIKEWNESNFDLNCCSYVQESSKTGTWAFVSDYARFWILYNYGGIYFDTDVELIKPIDSILNKGSFFCCEHGIGNPINPGLGMASPERLAIYKKILDSYSNDHFLFSDGTKNEKTVVTRVTEILKEDGYKSTGCIERVDSVYIYPPEYFCPLNYDTGKMNITNKTLAIHHYTASWHSKLDNFIIFMEKNKNSKSYRFRRLLTLPFRVVNKFIKIVESKY